MKEITCDYCKQSALVAPYYYNAIISTDNNFKTPEYKARVLAKAICPKCGYENIKPFSNTFTELDIIKFATRENE